VIDVNDAGVALIPCEVSSFPATLQEVELMGSTARNGSWNAVICTSGNEGEGGTWWLRNWQNSNELEKMDTGATLLQAAKKVLLLAP